MICPLCNSPAAKILPNTRHYTCIECDNTFGYIVGTKEHCPRCGSTDMIEKDGYIQCNNDNCHFIMCLGHYDYDANVDEWKLSPSCGREFQYQTGDEVTCPYCHPIGQLKPYDVVACGFINTIDTEKQDRKSVV